MMPSMLSARRMKVPFIERRKTGRGEYIEAGER